MTDDCDRCLISLALMRQLFPQVTQQTIHRWNTEIAGPGSRLPKPDRVIGSVPLWFEQTLIKWARERANPLTPDFEGLARIRRSQGLSDQ